MSVGTISADEKKILKAALKCGQQNLTLSGLVEETGLKPSVVCEKLNSPEFRQMFIDNLKSAVTAETPAIIHKFLEAAKEGSFKHGKLMLELAGVYNEKQKLELGGSISFMESPFKTDEERQAFIKNTLKNNFKEED